MDAQRFDRLTRQLTAALSRRRFGAILTLLGLTAGSGVALETEAKKSKKGSHHATAAKKKGKGKGKNKKPKKCKKSTIKCGKKCVNPKNNALHCGGCNRPCGAGIACANGACQDTTTCTPECGAGRQCIAGRCTCRGDFDCSTDPNGDWCLAPVPGNPTLAYCGCPESSAVCAAGEKCSACCSAADCDTSFAEICVLTVTQPVRTCCIPNGSVCGYRNDFCCSRRADDIRHDAKCVCAPPGDPCGTNQGCCSGVCQQATLTCG